MEYGTVIRMVHCPCHVMSAPMKRLAPNHLGVRISDGWGNPLQPDLGVEVPPGGSHPNLLRC